MARKPHPFVERVDAPIIAFDDAPFFSSRVSGLVALTLVADLALPTVDGKPEGRQAVVGILKTDLRGAKLLRDMLDRAILAATPTAGEGN